MEKPTIFGCFCIARSLSRFCFRSTLAPVVQYLEVSSVKTFLRSRNVPSRMVVTLVPLLHVEVPGKKNVIGV